MRFILFRNILHLLRGLKENSRANLGQLTIPEVGHTYPLKLQNTRTHTRKMTGREGAHRVQHVLTKAALPKDSGLFDAYCSKHTSKAHSLRSCTQSYVVCSEHTSKAHSLSVCTVLCRLFQTHRQNSLTESVYTVLRRLFLNTLSKLHSLSLCTQSYVVCSKHIVKATLTESVYTVLRRLFLNTVSKLHSLSLCT